MCDRHGIQLALHKHYDAVSKWRICKGRHSPFIQEMMGGFHDLLKISPSSLFMWLNGVKLNCTINYMFQVLVFGGEGFDGCHAPS